LETKSPAVLTADLQIVAVCHPGDAYRVNLTLEEQTAKKKILNSYPDTLQGSCFTQCMRTQQLYCLWLGKSFLTTGSLKCKL